MGNQKSKQNNSQNPSILNISENINQTAPQTQLNNSLASQSTFSQQQLSDLHNQNQNKSSSVFLTSSQSNATSQLKQSNPPGKQHIRKGGIFQLVLFQITKHQNCLFDQKQKYSLMYAICGASLSLFFATFSNMFQIMARPNPKYSKILYTFGITNIIASLGLGVLSYQWTKQMYNQVPEQQWNRVDLQRQSFQKLSFSQKSQFINAQIQKENMQKRKRALLQQARKQKQQNVELAK